MQKWYQEAVIRGVKMPTQRNNDTSEKRWEGLIKPLLLGLFGKGLFVDLGCNAGFYTRRAMDLGFKAIGIEIDDEYIKHARYWEKNEPKGIEIIQADICEYDLPVCQVALLANVHYWLTELQLNKLTDNLRERALSVIVVGRNWKSDKHKSPCGIDALRALFHDFTEIKSVVGRKHYSVIFNNPGLIEKDVDEIFNNQPLTKSRKFLKSFNKLIDDDSDPFNSDYYGYLKWRRFNRPEKLLIRRIELIKEIRKNGIKTPLLLGRLDENGIYDKNRLTDGDHRAVIAKRLGFEKVICRIWKPV